MSAMVDWKTRMKKASDAVANVLQQNPILLAEREITKQTETLLRLRAEREQNDRELEILKQTCDPENDAPFEANELKGKRIQRSIEKIEEWVLPKLREDLKRAKDAAYAAKQREVEMEDFANSREFIKACEQALVCVDKRHELFMKASRYGLRSEISRAFLDLPKFLAHDLLDAFKADLNRVAEASARRSETGHDAPAAAPQPKPVMKEAVAASVEVPKPLLPVAPVKPITAKSVRREPLNETTAPGEVRIRIFRDNIELRPGLLSLPGDVVSLPHDQAHAIMMTGGAEFEPEKAPVEAAPESTETASPVIADGEA